MISFRVSEREFELLKTKSAAEGARSISDFARLALCGPAGGSSERERGMLELAGEVQQLRADVRRVAELLEAARATVTESPRISLAARKSTRGA
jgi:hypothetical protein